MANKRAVNIEELQRVQRLTVGEIRKLSKGQQGLGRLARNIRKRLDAQPTYHEVEAWAQAVEEMERSVAKTSEVLASLSAFVCEFSERFVVLEKTINSMDGKIDRQLSLFSDAAEETEVER